MATGDGGVSFARDIRGLFREIDVAHMKRSGHLLDNYAWMSDAANDHGNARGVLATVRGNPPSMPPGGPYWSAEQVDLFARWMSGGYLL
jgi:hypothetical protein